MTMANAITRYYFLPEFLKSHSKNVAKTHMLPMNYTFAAYILLFAIGIMSKQSHAILFFLARRIFTRYAFFYPEIKKSIANSE